MLDVHAEDLSFVTLWPESEDGYAAWLAPKDEYRRLFGLLSRPAWSCWSVSTATSAATSWYRLWQSNWICPGKLWRSC